MSEAQPLAAGVKSVFWIGLIVVGCVLILGGLFLTFLVVAMFSSPGGLGAEKLFGPIFGFFALVSFLAGGYCLHGGLRVKRIKLRENAS